METLIFKTLNINGVEQEVLATSYSQIDVYSQCNHRWFMDYLLGEREFIDSEATKLGTSVHETLEQYFLQRKDGKIFTVGEALDLMHDNMENNKIPYACEENKVIAETQHNSMMSNLALETSELAKFMSDKEVIGCEQEFIYPVKLPFKVLFNKKEYDTIYIIGSIDFVVKDKDGGIYVVDFKSSKKTFEASKLRKNLQLPIYALVILQQYGRLPEGLLYYFTRFDEFQQVLKIQQTEEECEHVYFKNGKVKQYQRTVKEVTDTLVEIFREQYTTPDFPPNPSALCSWCSHGMYEKNNCEHRQFYKRKDIPIPKKNLVKIKGGQI